MLYVSLIAVYWGLKWAGIIWNSVFGADVPVTVLQYLASATEEE